MVSLLDLQGIGQYNNKNDNDYSNHYYFVVLFIVMFKVKLIVIIINIAIALYIDNFVVNNILNEQMKKNENQKIKGKTTQACRQRVAREAVLHPEDQESELLLRRNHS